MVVSHRIAGRTFCTWLTLALIGIGGLTVSAQGARQSGVLLVRAPVFLLPDATRTPLATLDVGTVVDVQSKEGDWYKVIFRDPPLGLRTGYIQAANMRVEDASPPTASPSGTPAAPTRPVPPSPQASAAASTPTPDRWANHGYVSANVGYQTTSNGFTGEATLTRNVEAGTLTTSYLDEHPWVLDIGVHGRVGGQFAAGGAVTWLSQDRDAAVSASLPHPFFFNAPRSVSGVATGVAREELAIHGVISWLVPSGHLLQIAVFGGPSYFHLKEDLVVDVTVAETYPYDTAVFVSAVKSNASKSGVGFNTGVDVAARLSKSIGVGAIVRYSRASLELSTSDADVVTVHAGGLQIGGGIRFAF